ncbi:MAG: hypothetical protein ACREUU_02405 [Gammaproteobacteria bacterium]
MKISCPSPSIRHLACFLVAAACLAAPLAASASGSYCSCMPKPPPVKAAKVDRDKFDLGQKVFNGKTAPATGDASAQRTRLAALQTQLPEKVAKKKDLTALAGKLTDSQLDALEYFVKERYPAAK